MATCATVTASAALTPRIRCDRRVRFLAAVVDDRFGQRQRAGRGDVGRPGMHHHRRRNVVENPGPQHQLFAATGLFGGRAQQRHPQPQFVRYLCQRQRGAHRRRRNDVVAARVPDLGQRVVLGAHADDERSAAEVGAERGVQATGARGDLETAFGDERLRLGATAVLSECQLRLGMDRMGQLDKVGTPSPYDILDGV